MRDIHVIGDPVLRTPAAPVTDFDRELRRLVELSPLVSRAEFRKLEERVKRLESLLTPGPEAPPAGAPPPPGDG